MSIDALQTLVKTSKVLRLSADDGEHMLYSMDTATSVFTLVLDGQVKVKSLPPHSTFDALLLVSEEKADHLAIVMIRLMCR